MTALVTVAAMFQAESVKASSIASTSKSGVAIACAKVNIATASVLGFGGKCTTAAVASGGDSNAYTFVTFTGKYPKDISTNNVIINLTTKANNYGVANGYIWTANATQLVIEVDGWISDTLAAGNETVFLTVFVVQ
jgi:hypothetical protein